MKTFGKISLSLFWGITFILTMLSVIFLFKHYDGYYWLSAGKPDQLSEIHHFQGSGFKLLEEVGIKHFTSLYSINWFNWGYVSNFEFDGKHYDNIMQFAQSFSNPDGTINWPANFNMPDGINLISVIYNILIVVFIVLPLMIVAGVLITIKLVNAIKYPHSIEFIDAKNNYNKTFKNAKKAIKKANKKYSNKLMTEEEFLALKAKWESDVATAKSIYENELKLYSQMKTQITETTLIKKLKKEYI